MLAWMSLQNFVILGYSTRWPAGPVLRTFAQYLVAFCTRLEAASDIISGVAVGQVLMDIRVKFGDSRSKVKRFSRYSRGSLCLERMNERT